MKRKSNMHSNIILISLTSFTIFLFFIGIYLIYSANSISEYPEFERYNIRIFYLGEGDSSVNVSDAQFSYHFDEKEGGLTLSPKKELKKIIIYFPEQYKLKEVVKIIPRYRVPVDITILQNESNDEKLVLIFNEDVMGDWIDIEFRIDLVPNARFSLSTNSIWKDNGYIYLNLGDNFKCIRDDCVFNLNNLRLTRRDTDPTSSARLEFIDQEADFEFEISAYSLRTINNKNFRISFGSSMIGGAIFALFSIIIAFYQHRGDLK